ncbi:MAG TPA: ATP-binding protein [Mariprofundaceae bacterium]|nr:ATP-binding protein [Mariprofundaceae bacterium]
MKPIVHSWFFGKIHPRNHALAYTQVQQAWTRIPMALLCLVYLFMHGPFFAVYDTAFEATTGLYLLYNLYIIYSIRRHPASSGRLLVSPILDVYVASFALVIDGGNISGLSLLYLAIILGNAFRYGNMMMLYTQALCLAGLVGAAIVSLQQLQIDTIWSLLGFQVAALLLLPAYAMSLAHRRGAQHATPDENQASFGLLDHGPLPVFTYHLDERGSPRIIRANAALQSVSREPVARLAGEQVDMLTLLEDGNIIVSHCRKALQQGSGTPLRFYIRGRDASDRTLNLMGEASRVRWHGQWIGLCLLVDISEHDRQTGFRNDTVVKIVHDFRNLLTGIIGQAETLQMDVQDPGLKHRLNPIIEAGERGADMISQLLNLGTRPAVERPQSQAADTRAALEKLTDLVRLQLPEKVTLNCHIDAGLPTPDLPTSELEQVMMNLIQNAYQAISDTGSIDIRVTADEHEAEPAGIVIQVADTGCGIARENLEKIFTTLWTTRRKLGGTGLGLALVKRIVEQHHGRIHVQSMPEHGSTFTIHLPARAGTRPSGPARQAPESHPAPDMSEAIDTVPWHILLVDDSPVVLKVHQAMLTRMGHRVVAVPDGQSALARFDRPDTDAFDLILTDYNMPGMDGVEMIRQLRDRGVQLPIMVITAYGEEARLQQLPGLDAGIIHKPVSYRALAAHIAAIQANRNNQPPQPETSPTNSEARKPS